MKSVVKLSPVPRPIGFTAGVIFGTLCLLASAVLFAGPVRAQSRIDPIDLLQGVRTLSSDLFSGRRVGSEGGALARAYLLDRLDTIGISACGTSLEHPFTLSKRNGEQQTGVNLIGIIEGTRDPDHYLVLSAHYDHLGTRNNQVYNGADDNASGTSAVLAIADALQKSRPEHSVLIALFDGEEQGSRGAKAFIENPCVPLTSLWMDVNLDMVSRSASRELYISGTYFYPELRPLLDKVGGDRPVSILFGHDTPGSGHDDWTDASDHGPFHRAGIPYIYFGVEDHPGYHKPSDDFSGISPAFYIDAVDIILDAVALMDENLDGIHEINDR